MNLRQVIFFLFSFVSVMQGQTAKNEQIKFFKENSHAIKVTGNSDYSDLKILDKTVKGKRIVLLGEFTHGSKEINLIKNRIIAYLHQKLGFNVLLLESGVGEVYAINFLRDSLSDRQMLYSGLTGPWHTLEYVDLMNYLKGRKSLKAGGFDVQRTGNRFSKVLEGLGGVLSSEKELILNVEKRYTELTNKLQDGKVQIEPATIQEKEKLVADYRALRRVIDANQKRLEEQGWDSIKLETVKRGFENRIEYLNYYAQFRADNDFRKRFSARDRVMAENIIWFADQIYPGEKIIISAHNYHISKSNEKESVMGELLAEKFGKDLYSVGVFGGSGEYAENSRKAMAMTQPTEESDIQTVVSRMTDEAAFLHIAAKKKKGGEWLFENITVNNSFLSLDRDNKLTLHRCFDGLVLIKNVTPPKFAY